MSISTEPVSSIATYKAAFKVSKVIEEHFAHQLSAAAARGERNLAPEPSKPIQPAQPV